jgi:predicted acetyltransferase
MLTVTPATAVDEPVLRNLVQLYAYDFAEIAGWEIPDSGRFPDEIIDGCFSDACRHPFLLRIDGRLAGFAIVDTRSRLTDDPGVRDVAEFFVARPKRGRGVGAEAARILFDRFGGRWEVRQTTRNTAAIAFWRKVIERYTGGRFEESMHDGPRWRGPVQTFVCP